MRRLFNFAAATSLLLCIAMGALWARSAGNWAPDIAQAWYHRWSQPDEVKSYYLEGSSYAGTIALSFGRTHLNPSFFEDISVEKRNQTEREYPPGFTAKIMPRPKLYLGCSRQMGFGAQYNAWTPGTTFRTDTWLLTFRPWLAMLLLSVLPALWLNGFRKARSASRKGLCAQCGYDLRASPQRCPECGTAVNQSHPIPDSPETEPAQMPWPAEVSAT